MAIEGIETKYSEIERTLNEEFAKSHRSEDIARMKDIALLLSNFNGYNRCIDDFIEHIQLQQYRGKNIFRDIVPLCQSSWDLIRQVSYLICAEVNTNISIIGIFFAGVSKSRTSHVQIRLKHLSSQIERAHRQLFDGHQ